MKIVVDTNVLIYSAKNKFDLINELKKYGATSIIIPEEIISELEKLTVSAKKGSDKLAAKLALQIINFSDVKSVKIGEGHTDNKLMEFADKNSCIIITNDSDLKKRLKNAKMSVLYISKNIKIDRA